MLPKLYFTEKGKQLLSKGIAGAKITFTKFQVGDGSLNTESAYMLESLKSPVCDFPIHSISTGENTANITCMFTNESTNEGYYFREFGIFAKGEDDVEVLYLYGNAANLAEYIHPGTAQLIERKISCMVLIGDSTNVTAEIDKSLTFATLDDLDQKAEEWKDNLTQDDVGLDKVDNTADSEKSVKHAEAATEAEALTTSAGSDMQPVYFEDGKPISCSHTLGKSVPSDAKFTDTNTWRGIQDNLTSTSTSDSLSANQGRLLANGSARDSTKLPLSGGTITGNITVNGTSNSIANLKINYNDDYVHLAIGAGYSNNYPHLLLRQFSNAFQLLPNTNNGDVYIGHQSYQFGWVYAKKLIATESITGNLNGIANTAAITALTYATSNNTINTSSTNILITFAQFKMTTDSSDYFASNVDGIGILKTGTYLVTASIYYFTYTGSPTLKTLIYGDDTLLASANGRPSGNYHTVSTSPMVVSLNAGTTVKLYAYTSTVPTVVGMNSTATYLTVIRLD